MARRRFAECHPRQVIVDLYGDNPCPLGLQAIYEKSVSFDDLKASIDEPYGKWALSSNATSAVKLWRVEPERFRYSIEPNKRSNERTDI